MLKFDQSGRYLALGDHAGRVIVFEAPDSKKKGENYEYCTEVTDQLTQFQAHVREFDALKSQDVDETLTGLDWMRNQGKYMKMVTSNSKDIKVWKIFEKAEKKVAKSAGKELTMPKVQIVGSGLTASLQ